MINSHLSTCVAPRKGRKAKDETKNTLSLSLSLGPLLQFTAEPRSHLLLPPSLTHLPKVDTLTPSAGAVHFPQGGP